jgi:hypothetical protein
MLRLIKLISSCSSLNDHAAVAFKAVAAEA